MTLLFDKFVLDEVGLQLILNNLDLLVFDLTLSSSFHIENEIRNFCRCADKCTPCLSENLKKLFLRGRAYVWRGRMKYSDNLPLAKTELKGLKKKKSMLD